MWEWFLSRLDYPAKFVCPDQSKNAKLNTINNAFGIQPI